MIRENKSALGLLLWLSGEIAAFILGLLLTSLLGEAVVQDSPGGYLSRIIIFTTMFVFGFLTWFYYTRMTFIGSQNTTKLEEYNAFCKMLETGGIFHNHYVSGIENLIRASEKIFVSANSGGVKKPAGWPELSAYAYDRWLLLGFLYPIGSMFFIWSLTGDVGPVAKEIGFVDFYVAWERLVFLIFTLSIWLLVAVAFDRVSANKNSLRYTFFLTVFTALVFGFGYVYAGASLFAVIFAFVFSVVFALVSVFVFARAGENSGLGAGSITFAFTFGVFFTISTDVILDLYLPYMTGYVIEFFLLVTISTLIAATFGYGFGYAVASFFRRLSPRYQLVIYGSHSLILFFSALLLPILLSPTAGWDIAGPMLLFLVVIVFVNAPFDWLSFGITLRFLRKGLSASRAGRPLIALGWGILDMLIAISMVFLLATVAVFVAQCFNTAILFSGEEKALVPINDILLALENDSLRVRADYWWIYIMIGSTLIPSIVHISIAAFAGLSWLMPGQIIHQRLSIETDWWWMAGVLAFLRVASLVIGAYLAYWLLTTIYWDWLPEVGLGWLGALEAIYEANLPSRLAQLFMRI